MYVAAYADDVHRKNIYLSAEEQAAPGARAAVEGSSRSVVHPFVVDGALNLAEGDEVIDAALGNEASEIAEAARRLSRGLRPPYRLRGHSRRHAEWSDSEPPSCARSVSISPHASESCRSSA